MQIKNPVKRGGRFSGACAFGVGRIAGQSKVLRGRLKQLPKDPS